MANQVVEIGHRFQSLNAFGRVWEVEAIYLDANKRPHATLRDVADRTALCTLACGALLNSGRFRLVSAGENPAAPGLRWRRRAS